MTIHGRGCLAVAASTEHAGVALTRFRAMNTVVIQYDFPKKADMGAHLVRVQEKGQVTLPAAVRKRLGLRKGDLVSVEVTPQGALITPQEVIATRALDRIGEALRERGLTLEQMIESGRDERAELIAQLYGLEPQDESIATPSPARTRQSRPRRSSKAT
jgi:AbrB family looped-hinge helix DNA binding protein